jgi:hypothetical protein
MNAIILNLLNFYVVYREVNERFNSKETQKHGVQRFLFKQQVFVSWINLSLAFWNISRLNNALFNWFCVVICIGSSRNRLGSLAKKLNRSCSYLSINERTKKCGHSKYFLLNCYEQFMSHSWFQIIAKRRNENDLYICVLREII